MLWMRWQSELYDKVPDYGLHTYKYITFKMSHVGCVYNLSLCK